MKTFTDTKGRCWRIDMTISAVKRVKGALEVDLLRMDQGDPPLLTVLGTDVEVLCDIIFCLVMPQAEELGVSDVQFGEAMGGETMFQAQVAFYEELADFFRGLGRVDTARALQMQQEMMSQAVKRVEAALSQFDAEKALDNAFKKIPGALSMSLPVSSESTPVPSPSES